MARYLIPAARVRVQETILRSRFITTMAAAESPEQARGFVAEVRAEFPDANHHCFAYVAGRPGSTAQIGISDDGEPGGTAGRPMLAVLLGSGVGDIAAVVTRFFGGNKLGTGGLVRAYSGGVKSALAVLPVREKVPLASLQLKGAYHWISALDRLLPTHEAHVTERTFGADVAWNVTVPEERLDALVAAITELSGGEIRITGPAAWTTTHEATYPPAVEDSALP
jgi:uncharacterized YigZ family protein